MPTTQKPKQTKATQKAGGKAPVPQAKTPAKTRGGKAPVPQAKAPAKTQGGKAPVPQAKAPAKTQGGKAPTSLAKTQGGKGKAPASQAKVRGGYDPDPECTIENICDDCNSMGRLETLINSIIPIEEYKELSDDKKQDYLKKVKCLKNKVKNTRPGLFSRSGKELKETIYNFNELLRNNNSVDAKIKKPPLLLYPPPPLGKSRMCTIEDFNNCKDIDISERCAYTPLGLKTLEPHVNNIETEINKYHYKNKKSDSMLETLECLEKFLKSHNYNSSNWSLYKKIVNYIKKIKELPFRTGKVNNHLPPIR
jgi:hypothetical protein